ncbi:hypothetical protein GCM10023116_17520 [Kistimonas scapharcae]|uniref:Uncharacterized protein n=1 Tax=Kistimonas scapharcae TaxID=1036133 RepID=A0ABP8V221_9GAMM
MVVSGKIDFCQKVSCVCRIIIGDAVIDQCLMIGFLTCSAIGFACGKKQECISTLFGWLKE